MGVSSLNEYRRYTNSCHLFRLRAGTLGESFIREDHNHASLGITRSAAAGAGRQWAGLTNVDNVDELLSALS